MEKKKKNLPAMQETWAGDEGLIPELGRFPWRRKWQHTPVFFAWEIPIHGVKKELDTPGQLNNDKDALILIPGT